MDMADSDKQAAPAKSGSKKLLVILALVNFAAVGGLAAYILWPQVIGSAQAAGVEPSAAESKAKEFGPIVEFRPLVANLHDGEATRYVKATIHLEVVNEKVKSQIEALGAPIRSRLIIYFADLTVKDTLGAEKKAEIREQLRRVINETLGGEQVKNVYFSDFVVQ
jgi:flagellar FliL protein